MGQEFWLVINPIISLGVNVAVQVMSFRKQQGNNLLKSIGFGFVGGLFVMCCLQYTIGFWTKSENQISILFMNILIYASLGYGYFSFINLMVSSMRVRILMELYNTKNGLSLEGILKRYNGEEQIKLRTNRLISSGQIKYREGKYFIGKPAMVIIAKIITIIKLIVIGTKPGFVKPVKK